MDWEGADGERSESQKTGSSELHRDFFGSKKVKVKTKINRDPLYDRRGFLITSERCERES